MLQQIMPDKVGLYWNKMKDRVDDVIRGVPGESIHKLNNILHNLLSGKMVGWVSYHYENGRRRSDAFLVTEVVQDSITETKSLLLFCMIGVGRIPDDSWKEGFKALEKYGISRGCTRMTAYTEIDYIVQRVKELGGAKEYSFVSIPFNKESSR